MRPRTPQLGAGAGPQRPRAGASPLDPKFDAFPRPNCWHACPRAMDKGLGVGFGLSGDHEGRPCENIINVIT